MESYEGSAVLEWWANRSTCLGSFGVRVTAHRRVRRWAGRAWPTPPLSDEGREGFDFLMALDPVFTLRFDDDSTVLVHVTEPDRPQEQSLERSQEQTGRLILSEVRSRGGEAEGGW